MSKMKLVLDRKVFNIVPKSEEQKSFIQSIEENQITIVYGKAGTGKTMISTMWGFNAFAGGKYEILVFTRPCVEANGEKLGHLPGDVLSKISVYMTPIMDILETGVEKEYIDRLVKANDIKQVPFAFLRGISFHQSFILADEVENATKEQIRLLITRIGNNSKMVLTGDPYQSDIGYNNGLVDAIDRLKGIKGIGIVELTKLSIFRNPIIAEVENRYEKEYKKVLSVKNSSIGYNKIPISGEIADVIAS